MITLVRLRRRLLAFADLALGRLTRRTAQARVRHDSTLLHDLRLFDARRWRNGFNGPPFGHFPEARLSWYRELLAETRGGGRADGLVLTRWQLDLLVRLADRARGVGFEPSE